MLTEKLNSQQLQAVTHGEGPLMVVAGAGSGKTRVITCRIASLIRERSVDPGSILAITFTNKAAREMRERVHGMLDGIASPPWIGTFHAFCLRVLRQHMSALGRSNGFLIYDAQDQLSLVKQCMKAMSMDDKAHPPKTLLNHISGFKNDYLLPEDVNLDDLPYGNKLKAGLLYPAYQEGLKNNNALDFDDLLMMTVQLFRESERTLNHYNQTLHYILVDEFQDTNAVQYHLVRLLSGKVGNICVVGDDDQSIYRWRGANLENILNFENDFPGTTVIKLEENYRSTGNILAAAGGVVKENTNRKPKTLWTQNEKGDPIVCYRAENEIDEARNVCSRALELNREAGTSFSDMAVLYRTHAQSRVVEDVLREMHLPCQLIGGLRFYERKEIKDVLAFMRVVINPADSVSLKRIINVPPRGIGKTSLDKVEAYCRENSVSFAEGLRLAQSWSLVTPAAGSKISQFMALLGRLDATYRSSSVLDFLREILECTGYSSMLQKDDSLEGKGRMENLNELFSAVEQAQDEGKSLHEFLDSVALVSDMDKMDDSRGALSLMTLHTCKGLEFEVVFIIGLEDGLLPHASSLSNNEEYEEERRLCYVGFTRARKKLYISHARRRRIYGNNYNYPPSEFLSSIPGEIVVRETSPEMEYRPVSHFSSPASYSHREFPEPVVVREASGKAWSVGTKVLHSKFGKGVVINLDGGDDDLKVEVFFQKPHGKKKLAVNFANLIVL